MNPISSTPAETPELLDDVERFAERRFHYRSEIEILIQLATTNEQKKLFEEIIFLAKFLWSSYNVMQRIGPTGEGYTKLSSEFNDSLEKMTTLIKTLIRASPEDFKDKFKTLFFSISQGSMNNLLRLVADLSWLKNYSIDTRHSIV